MSTEQGSVASGGPRALAWLSIVCGLVLVVILVVFAVRNLPALARRWSSVWRSLALVGGG